MGYMYALSWESDHHLSQYLVTLLKRPEGNSHKMFHISLLIVLFSFGKLKDVLGEQGSNFI